MHGDKKWMLTPFFPILTFLHFKLFFSYFHELSQVLQHAVNCIQLFGRSFLVGFFVAEACAHRVVVIKVLVAPLALWG